MSSQDGSSKSLGPFLLLEAATLLSGAGNGAAVVVLPWLVLERTGSAGAAGILAAATAVPLLMSSLVSGTVVDRFGRRRTAIFADVLSAVSVGAIPIVDRVVGLDLAWLVGLAVLGAVFDPAGVTARETMLPAAAGRAAWTLDRANGVHEAVWGVAYLIGPAVGGVLIAWVGAVDALWVTTAAFVASTCSVALVRLPEARPDHVDDHVRGMWNSTREGLRFVWNDRLLLAVTALTAVLLAVYMPVEGVLLPVHFEATDQPGRLGVIMMAMSGGGVAGALAYGALGTRVRRSTLFRGSLLVAGACVLALAALPAFPVMVLAAAAAGFAYGPIGPLINLSMQIRSPEHMRGRIVGVITSTEYAAGPVGYLLVGGAVQRFGLASTFVAVGALILAVGVIGLAIRPLGEMDDLASSVPPPHGVTEVLDVAVGGAVPLIRPPRDPDHPGATAPD